MTSIVRENSISKMDRLLSFCLYIFVRITATDNLKAITKYLGLILVFM